MVRYCRQARRIAAGGTSGVFEPRECEFAAGAFILMSLSTGLAMNRFSPYMMIKKVFNRDTEQVFKGNHAL